MGIVKELIDLQPDAYRSAVKGTSTTISFFLPFDNILKKRLRFASQGYSVNEKNSQSCIRYSIREN